MRISRLLPIIGVFSLMGCSESFEHYNDPTSSYVNPAINTSVDRIIAENSVDAVNAIQTVARMERTKTPPTVTDPNAGAPAELKLKVTELNWSGTAEALVKSLAEKVGYSYVPMAVQLETPLMVNLDIQNRTVAEALDDIDLQIHDRAHIIVDAAEHTMAIRPIGAQDKPVYGDQKSGPPKGKGGRPPHPPRHVYHPGQTS